MPKKSRPKINLPVSSDIASSLVNQITSGIRTPTKERQRFDLLDWTLRFRRFMGEPPSIPHNLVDIYQDTHPEIVIMKAAQVGISEYGINTVIWGSDQVWGDRGVSLFIFPKQEQMDDFSQARVNKAIEESYYLKERVRSIDQASTTNRTRLKRIGSSPMYFRGSDAITQIRSIDADILVADEVDIFREGIWEKAKERLGSSKSPLFRAFSQPRYPNGPIDVLFQASDQRYYYLTCEHCSEKQRLTWEDNTEFSTDATDIRIVCRNCRQPIDRLAKGEWIAHEPGNYAHGYHVSKLYSPRADLLGILRNFLAIDDPARVESFHNADLGVPYKPEGTPGLESYRKESYPWRHPYAESYMGIDVGRYLHVCIIGRGGPTEKMRLIDQRRVSTFNELESLWLEMRPRMTIIDAQGDPRATSEWADNHYGRVSSWMHRPSAIDPKFVDNMVYLHRTSLLDLLYGALKSHAVWLHIQADAEFWSHLESNIREIAKDNQGRLFPRYMPMKADHYAFALAFAILASGTRISSGDKLSVMSKAEVELVPSMVAPKSGGWTGEEGHSWSRWRAGGKRSW